MKKEKSLKALENSENHSKGKSTNANTTINDKLKYNKLKKISDIPSIKRSKKIILYINTNNEINSLSRHRSNKKLDISNNKKIDKLKNIIIGKKLVKTELNDSPNKKLENSNISKKSKDLTKSPPTKKLKKEKNKILIISSLNTNKGKKFINSEKNLKNSFCLKKKTKDELLTYNNTNINKQIQNVDNFLKIKEKKKRKTSLNLDNTKLFLDSNDIKLSRRTYTPIRKNNKKYINNEKNINLNKTYNKNLDNSRFSTKNKNIKNDIPRLPKKENKTKFIFSTLVYRNKGDSFRNRIIFLSKNKDKNDKNNNKNINSFTSTKNNKIPNLKNKTIENFNTSSKINLNLSREGNSNCEKINSKANYKTEKINNYLNTENNIINKKLRSNKNSKKNLHNYLKYTVSALNKIINNKKDEKNKNFSKEQKRSKTIEKNIFSIKRKFKEKNDYYLTHRNTVSRYKIKEINNLKIDPTHEKSSSNRLILSNTSRAENNKIDEYTMLKELGKGSYATVKLAIHKKNHNKYAIKIYSKKSLLDKQKKGTVDNEIKILKQLDNINIMKLYEVIDTPNYLYLILEYIEGISLLDTIKKDSNHYFEEQRALKIFQQILNAIIYCQNKNICHRDIKLENILIKNNDIIKLIDFGFAVKSSKGSYQNLFCGSPSYMAPEIVNKQKYIAQYSDIWSLGVLFYSMLYGRFPFKAQTQKELFKKINEAKVEFPEDIEINDKIKILLKKIFVIVPAQRPSLKEILNDILLLIN